MREQLLDRLQRLKAEFEAGQQRLASLEEELAKNEGPGNGNDRPPG